MVVGRKWGDVARHFGTGARSSCVRAHRSTRIASESEAGVVIERVEIPVHPSCGVSASSATQVIQLAGRRGRTCGVRAAHGKEARSRS